MTGLMKNGNPDQIPDEPANRDLAKPSEKKELSFDEKVEALDRFIHFEPLIREVDYKTLLFCETRRNLSDIEEAMASFPACWKTDEEECRKNRHGNAGKRQGKDGDQP